MKTFLNILHLEDNPNDAELVQSLLEGEGIACKIVRVETRTDFLAAVTRGGFDIILADYQLPSFDGLAALAIAQKKCPNVPFIIVSGTLGEEAAIKSFTSGATDYVHKHHINRLIPIVHRALNEAREKKLHKQAELEIIEREKELRFITESSLDTIFAMTKTGKFQYISPSIKDLIGYEPGEIIGTPFTQHIPKKEIIRCWQLIKEVFQTKKIVRNFDTFVKHRDGRLIPVDVSGQLVKQKGRWIAQGSIRNITERKQAEDKLKASEEKFRALAETAREAIITADSNGNIIYFNKGAEEMFGNTAAEIVGKSMTHIMPKRFQDAHVTGLKRFISTGKATVVGKTVELVGRKKDGREFPIELSLSIWKSGEDIFFGSIIRDITERKNLEREKEKLLSDRAERIKELECLYGTFKSISKHRNLDEIFQDVADLIPPGWQYPNITRGKVKFDGKEYVSAPFKETNFKQTSEIVVNGQTRGSIEVYYLEECPELDEGPFISEERNLINVLAQKLGNSVARKQAEEKIRFLSSVVEQSADGMAISNLEGNLLFVNDSWVSMHGYKSQDELIDKNLNIFHNKMQLKNEVEPFNRKVMEKGYNSDEVGHIYQDGTIFPTLMTTSLIRDENGNPIAIADVAANITERKQAEEMLKQSEAKFRQLFKYLPDAIFVTQIGGSNAGQILDVNPAAEIQTGYTRDELIDMNLLQNLATEDSDKNELAEIEKRLLANETVYMTEKKLRKNGSEYWSEILITSIMYGNEKVALSVNRDITDRKNLEKEREQAEEELRQSEEKFRTLFEESNDAIYISTVDAKFIDINQAGVELFGYPKEELLETKIFKDLISNPLQYNKFEDTIQKQGYAKDFEITLNRKDGKKITVLDTATAVRDDEGKITAYRGIIRDITEKKNLEQQLFNIQRLESIGFLAGGIAHDFNNIITAISGYSELLLMKISGDNPLRQDIVGIQKAGQRAANLTRQLLAFSRQQIIEPKVFDINSLITDLNKMLHRLIGEDIQLETNLVEEISPIKADPGQVEQILINLIVNSMDAINQAQQVSSDKKITIETKSVVIDKLYASQHTDSKEGPYVLITVSDNGVGIKRDTINKIFDPFFTTKPKDEGTGLGLSTVYGIVKQNGGMVNVYSEPDIGTVIKIYWPTCDDEDLQEFDGEKKLKIVGGTETILFVEDDEAVRNSASVAMESLGYTVIKASDGLEALEIIRNNHSQISLLISDVVMPNMGGKELSVKINKIRPDIKIIFASGYAGSQIANKGILEEGINFILKPYSILKLSQKIRDALDSKILVNP